METCAISHTDVGQINTTTLKILIESQIQLTLVDAREAPWDDGRRIPGAISVTSSLLIQELIPEKESLIIVYCSHLQCGASGRLAKHLHELGYRFVLKYPEGIEGWANSGYPTVVMGKKGPGLTLCPS